MAEPIAEMSAVGFKTTRRAEARDGAISPHLALPEIGGEWSLPFLTVVIKWLIIIDLIRFGWLWPACHVADPFYLRFSTPRAGA